jgi:hypothetical protein
MSFRLVIASTPEAPSSHETGGTSRRLIVSSQVEGVAPRQNYIWTDAARQLATWTELDQVHGPFLLGNDNMAVGEEQQFLSSIVTPLLRVPVAAVSRVSSGTLSETTWRSSVSSRSNTRIRDSSSWSTYDP